MANEGRYRVTRSGREIFNGGAGALADAAREGRFLANDLVFDPEADSWVFARGHAIVAEAAGDQLHRRPASRSQATPRPKVRPTTVPRRHRVAVAVTIAALIAVMLAIPWGEGGNLMSFLYEREAPPPVETQAARPAAAAAPGDEEAPVDEEAPAAAEPPADLAFDPGAFAADGPRHEPTDAERRAYADRYLGEARAALDDPTPPPGDERLRQLLTAVQKAELAKLNLERIDATPAERAAAREAIRDLESAFQEACVEEHGARYCELKLKYPQWPHGVLVQVAEEQVLVGMDADQVRAAWGRPTRMRKVGQAVTYCYGQLCGRSVTLVNRIAVEVDD